MTSNEPCSVRVKVEEDYDQVVVEDDRSDGGTEEDTYEQHCFLSAERWGGSRSPSRAVSEVEDESTFDDVTQMELDHQSSHYESQVPAKNSFGTDYQRTLGEILAYCQVMYGAIQKLDEKFEKLQAKVTSIQAIPPSRFCQLEELKAQLSTSSSELHFIRTDAPAAPEVPLPMPQLVRMCSTPPPPSGAGKKPPPLSPAPGVPSPPPIAPQSLSSHLGKSHVLSGPPSHALQLSNTSPKLLQMSPPTAGGTVPITSSQSEKKRCLGCRRRKVFVPCSVLQKAERKPHPRAAIRILLRSVFSLDELISSNTNGNASRGLRQLDLNKITALREWAAKRYPGLDLRENSRDWRACLSVINSTARYLRLMAKKHKRPRGKEAVPVIDTESDIHHRIPCSEPKATAEIDVELSDSDTGDPLAKHRSTTAKEQQHKAPKSGSRSTNQGEMDTDGPYVYLGDPERGVSVPAYAMSTACQRSRPELVARFLIKYLFPEDVLVCSNVYGNTELGIHPLDHNKISALREHLMERFPWLLLAEDGQDWRVCVGAINSTIRKFRHERKKGRVRRKSRGSPS